MKFQVLRIIGTEYQKEVATKKYLLSLLKSSLTLYLKVERQIYNVSYFLNTTAKIKIRYQKLKN